MAIKIKGIIGWDVDGYTFSDKLSRLSGDIEFEIDSPGGSVSHGISIANAIKKYDRGKCTMHVVGQCASMALYIAMCGDEKPEFEPNAICIAHNPYSTVSGNYRDMRKQAEILEKMAVIYAKPFIEKGLFTEPEIRAIMDAETWFVGEEDLKKLGTVRQNPECHGGGEFEDDETVKREALSEAMARADELLKASAAKDLTEMAAFVAELSAQPQSKPKEEQKAINTSKNEKGTAQMAEMADKTAYEAEVKRRDSLLEFIDVDKDAVVVALKDGTTVTDPMFQAKILRARINAETLKGMADDNPPAVQPAEETHAPEDLTPPQPTEEEKAKAQEAEMAKALAEVEKYL